MIADWIEWLGLTPAHALAFLLGTLIALVITQTAKKLGQFGGRYAFWLAVVAGALSCYTIAPPEGFGLSWPSLWLSILCGLAATRVYRIGLALLRYYKPELARALESNEHD